jgi:polysaccharide export outer membrane protein
MRLPVAGSLAGSLVLVSILIVAEVTHGQGAATAAAVADARKTGLEAYRIGPEDMLRISVWKNEAMSSASVLVRPDGMISLPLLNDVKANGLTALELRDVLTEKLKEFVPNPEVSVIVSDIRSLKVSVMGEVARPGRFELRSWVTVLDALALAGGFTQYASRSSIAILRADGATMKRIPFNYNKVADGQQENFYLRQGDIVLVP